MPLNIAPRSSEDFVPYIKFDAKAGRWFTKNEGESGDTEVKDMTAIFDLYNIKLGWLLFTEGGAPEALWDNGKIEPPPTPKHKRGFCLNLFSPQKIGGLREFRSNANAAITAIKELYEQQFETAPECKRGLMPLVTCENVRPVKSKFGTNYEPIFKIVKWVPRPQAMPGAQIGNGHDTATGTAAEEETVPPPNTARRPAEAPVDEF
jgi:hypothetical protein